MADVRRGMWEKQHGSGLTGPPPTSHVPCPPFRYAEREPSHGASRLVLSYWSFQADAPPPEEPYTVFPDGCASVACVRPGNGMTFLALVGPRASHFRPPFSQGTRIWGIRLWPDAIGPALGLRARELRDHFGAIPGPAAAKFAGLPGMLPMSDDADIVFPALDAFAAVMVASAADPDARIRAAIRTIVSRRGEGSMEEVARAAAIGLRQLQRLFPEATGLTLREYARVRRLREALAMRLAPGRPGWSAIAADTGFVDHSHLTREFVALAGIGPSQAALQLTATAHRAVRP